MHLASRRIFAFRDADIKPSTAAPNIMAWTTHHVIRITQQSLDHDISSRANFNRTDYKNLLVARSQTRAVNSFVICHFKIEHQSSWQSTYFQIVLRYYTSRLANSVTSNIENNSITSQLQRNFIQIRDSSILIRDVTYTKTRNCFP